MDIMGLFWLELGIAQNMMIDVCEVNVQCPSAKVRESPWRRMPA